MLTLSGSGTLQQQVCEALRSGILQGRYRGGSRLPASRILADDLGVSRNTVLASYEQLISEGYLEAKTGSGTYVVDLPEPKIRKAYGELQPAWSRLGQRLLDDFPGHLLFRQPRRSLPYDFLYGEPAYDRQTMARWARVIGHCARNLDRKLLGYGPPSGLEELKSALLGYLHRTRGVVAEPSQLFLVQGTQAAIELCCQTLIDEGTTAVIEEPHYRGFERCLRAAGARIKLVGVDDQGLQVEALNPMGSAKILFATPSHQFPYGSILSLERRVALLEWARNNSTIIVEDDYDGEFRYQGNTIPSLQSLDKHGSVIYVGTTSKMLFPALRLGWMVVPKSMVDVIQRVKNLADSGPSTVEQLAFLEFLTRGYLDQHILRVRKQHRARRETLLQSLADEFGDSIEVTGTEAGVHILVRFRKESATRLAAVVTEAEALGVGVYPATTYYSSPPEQLELLLGYASLSTTQIAEGIRRLATLFQR